MLAVEHQASRRGRMVLSRNSTIIFLTALPVAEDAGEGRRHRPKGFLPTAWRRVVSEVSRTSWEEQGIRKVH